MVGVFAYQVIFLVFGLGREREVSALREAKGAILAGSDDTEDITLTFRDPFMDGYVEVAAGSENGGTHVVRVDVLSSSEGDWADAGVVALASSVAVRVSVQAFM